MFDEFRDAFRAAVGARSVTDRRGQLAGMQDALVHAKLALQDLREGIARTEQRIAAEQTELETLARRRVLAEGIGDAETVAVADRFVAQHSERLRVQQSKRLAQLDELAVAEREYDEMKREFKRAQAGLGPEGSVGNPMDAAMREVDEALGESARSADQAALDAMARAATRQQREAEAESRLAALKRQMGKDA